MSILTDHTAEASTTASGFDMLASREYVAPRANLLPPEMAERLALRRLTAGMIAAVVACGGIVGAVYYSTDSGRAPARAALAASQSQHDSLLAQQAKLAPSQTAHAEVLTAQKSLQAAMGSEVLWSDQLNSLRSHLTAGVRLVSLAVSAAAASTGATAATGTTSSTAVTLPSGPANQPGAATSAAAPTATTIATVTMNGNAVSNYAVADWLDTLATLDGWSNVSLATVSTDPASGIVAYDITANITSAALSNRYTSGS